VARRGLEGNEEKFLFPFPRPKIGAPNKMSAAKKTSPWSWVPTLYVAEGLPYALVMSVALVLYQNLGVPNPKNTFFVGLLYLPWVIKPLWSPAVDILKTRRAWIWTMQILVGAALAGVALAVPSAHFFAATLAFFWLLAFAAATHDVAADGFYLLALNAHDQAWFNGIRTTFYRVAGILAKGQLVILAGILAAPAKNFSAAWSLVFGLVAIILLLLGIYHRWVLPRPAGDQPIVAGSKNFAGEFARTFTAFFQKPGIGGALLFLLVYRFGEAQLMPVTQLFLLDAKTHGGLGLTNAQVGFAYNTVGVIALITGGLLGGFAIARRGLKFWLWPMLLAIHLPDAVFVWLAAAPPQNLFAIGAGIAVEQFGYGFGFAFYMLYMLHLARGPHATAHYALCTGFMALGMMVPGLWSGWLQSQLGYKTFFIWVLLATIPSFLAALKISLATDFGRPSADA
jgi:MFS transporter, PAT family, beta-lactamase induction signal transducer AmpG